MLGDGLERGACLAFGLVVVGNTEQPAQPRIAGEVAGDHHELLAVDLEGGADQWLDADLAARLQKTDSAVDAAGVGDGERRHLELGGSHRQLIWVRAAVEEGEVGVAVELDIWRRVHHARPRSVIDPLDEPLVAGDVVKQLAKEVAVEHDLPVLAHDCLSPPLGLDLPASYGIDSTSPRAVY